MDSNSPGWVNESAGERLARLEKQIQAYHDAAARVETWFAREHELLARERDVAARERALLEQQLRAAREQGAQLEADLRGHILALEEMVKQYEAEMNRITSRRFYRWGAALALALRRLPGLRRPREPRHLEVVGMAVTERDYPERGWAVVPCFTQDPSIPSIPVELLTEMENHPLSPGKSSWGTRNMLYALVLSLRPRRVLEIGTLIGSASVVMGTALKANGYGELICLEPQQHYFDVASKHVAQAGLSGIVRIIRKYSYDESLKQEIFLDTFDLIFIDAAHNYEAASFDINLSAEHLSENGFIVLDDVGAETSPKMDETGKGGVRQALIDFQRSHSTEYKTIFFEWPLWLNPMGMALLSKQRAY